jgi:hypothetical protein
MSKRLRATSTVRLLDVALRATRKKVLPGGTTIALMIALSGCMHHREIKPYSGDWVMQAAARNFAVLHTHVHHGRLTGTIEMPQHFTESAPSGTLSGIYSPIITKPVCGTWNKGSVDLLMDRIALL